MLFRSERTVGWMYPKRSPPCRTEVEGRWLLLPRRQRWPGGWRWCPRPQSRRSRHLLSSEQDLLRAREGGWCLPLKVRAGDLSGLAVSVCISRRGTLPCVFYSSLHYQCLVCSCVRRWHAKIHTGCMYMHA